MIQKYISLLLFITYYSFNFSHQLIILTGSSCSGKSSIAHHLLHYYPDGCIEKLDDFRKDFLQPYIKDLIYAEYNYTTFTVFFEDFKKNLQSLSEQNKSARLKQFNQLSADMDEKFYDYIKLKSEKHTIIVDTILFADTNKYIKKFPSEKLSVIFVHVPFKDIINRVKSRSSSASESRYINRILYFYPSFYTIISNNGQEVLDTVTIDQIEQCCIQSASLLNSKLFPAKLKLAQEIVKKFKIKMLDKQLTYGFVPTLQYDLTINSAGQTPQKSAEDIYQFMRTKKDAVSAFTRNF
jgi:uridine kinase